MVLSLLSVVQVAQALSREDSGLKSSTDTQGCHIAQT